MLKTDAQAHTHSLEGPCSVCPRHPHRLKSIGWADGGRTHRQINPRTMICSAHRRMCHVTHSGQTGSRHRPASPWQPPVPLPPLSCTVRPVVTSVPAGWRTAFRAAIVHPAAGGERGEERWKEGWKEERRREGRRDVFPICLSSPFSLLHKHTQCWWHLIQPWVMFHMH